MLMYGPYFCEENQWNEPLFPQGADAGVPHPNRSEAFYTEVFEYAHSKGGYSYEVDFMSELYLGIPEFRRSYDASTKWLRGMGAAGKETKTAIQFCMMHPNDLLTTLELDWVGHDYSLQNFTQVLRKKQQLNRVVFDDDAIVCNEKRIVYQDRLGTNATQNRTVKGKTKNVRFLFFPSSLLQVTNGRASPDYANSLNTFIGSSSLLFWAAGLRPSKDNFWTSDGARKKRHFLRCRYCSKTDQFAKTDLGQI